MKGLVRALLTIGVLFPTFPAAAAILWFGGEDTGFTIQGAAAFGSAGTGYDTNFARVAYIGQNSTTVADPPANRIVTPTFSAGSTVWVHGRAFIGTTLTTTSGEQGLILRSPDGVSRIIVRQTGANGTLKVSTRNAAGTITDLATSSVTFAGSFTLDVFVNYTCSGAGAVQLYINNTQGINFSGNPCTDSATQLNQADFASFTNGSGGNCSTSVGTCWSEIIIANEDTRLMRLATCAPQAAGNTQQFTPNTLANVNKPTISDGTFVSTSTNNQLSQWTCPTTAPSGIWGVKSVSIESRMMVSTTGPQNFDWSWRIAGSDYLAGTTTAATNAFLNYRLQQDTSPATGTAWGIAEVYNTSANQLGVGVKSLP